MDGVRATADPDHLAAVVRSALGGTRRLTGVARLRGGSKKGVYRLTADDGSTVIAYIWGAAENYWPNAPSGDAGDQADPFSDASDIELFQTASSRLGAAGIRTPRIYLADRSKSCYPADIALVEDVPGDNLETRLRDDPRGARATVSRLAEVLGVMRRHAAPHFGKVALIDNGGSSQGSCAEVILGRALGDLTEAAARDARIAHVGDLLESEVRGRAAAVRPRTGYGLVHGELGPDHVLVDHFGQPVLIDIEGLTYFDAEWEHAFLRIRFGEHYHWLDSGGLDEQRLAFYTLAMRLSLVAGPLRLLDGDFPDRDFMLEVAEHNLQQTLRCLSAGGY